jgi:hypothetical protein
MATAVNKRLTVDLQRARHSTMFRDITPCNPLVIRRFGRTYCLLLQGRKISRARYQRESRQLANGFLDSVFLGLLIDPEDGGFHSLEYTM